MRSRLSADPFSTLLFSIGGVARGRTMLTAQRGRRAAVQRALASPIESLEGRVMLSFSAATYTGAYTSTGTQWTYSETSPDLDGTETMAESVVGPTTYNGQSVTQLNITTTTVSTDTPPVTTTTAVSDYLGLNSAGLVTYGDSSASAVGTYSPYLVGLPATLVVGTPVSTTATGTGTDTGSDGTTKTTTGTIAQTFTLPSNSTQSITVPAGTYNCLEVDVTNTRTSSTGTVSTDSDQEFFAPGVGEVEEIDGTGTDQFTQALTSFTGTGEKLVFTQNPPTTAAAGNPVNPAVQVSLEDSSGNVISSDSDTIITLTPTGSTASNPVTGNTATAVNGVATFSSLTFADAGTYTLQATDGIDTAANSSSFQVLGDHLAFTTQPVTVGIGEPILYTVALEDSDNNVITTDSTDSVSVAMSSLDNNSAGPESAVQTLANGAYSDSDKPLIYDVPGSFTLTATEFNPDTGTVATTAEATSTEFDLTGAHLVFKKQPEDSDTNVPIPYIIQLENSKGEVITGESYNELQFTITNLADGTSATVNANGTFSSGVFADTSTEVDSNSLVIPTSGTYTLKAVEIGTIDGGAVAGVTSATSRPFKVSGDHLAFTKPPAASDVNEPVPFTLQLEDSKDKVISTENTNEVDFVENNLTEGTSVTTTQYFPLVNGVEDNSSVPASAALTLDTPGKYTLTAYEVQPDGTAVSTTDSAISKAFVVSGLHLAFKSQPDETSVGAPIAFVVELEDARDKIVDTENTNQVSISLNAGGTAAVLTGNPTDPLVNGVDTQTPTSGVYSVNLVGTYTLTAEEVMPGGTVITTTSATTSKSFDVTGNRLVFVKGPSTADAGSPVPFVLEVENNKGKVVSTENTNEISYTLDVIGSGTALGAPDVEPLVDGVDNNTAQGAGLGISIATPGKYLLDASEIQPDATAIDSTSTATSKTFTVVGNHLVFKTQPKNENAGDPLPFVVELENAQNQIIDDSDDSILYTLTVVAGGSGAALDGVPTSPLVDGTDDESTRVPADQLSIDVAGSYTLTAKEVDSTGDPVLTTSPVTSKLFKITT